MTAVQHPHVEIGPVMARFEQHLFMVSAQGKEVIPVVLQGEYLVEDFFAGRTAIYGVAQQVNVVTLPHAEYFVQKATESPRATVDIRYDKTTVYHG